MKSKIQIILFFLLATSCFKETSFEEYKFCKNQIWDHDSSIVFNYIVKDTINRNKITIKVRHTTDYEFQNLFLLINTERTRDTLEIKLADKEGSWLGSGIGDVREREVFYRKNILFDNKKKFVFEIKQAMRYGDLAKIQKLEGIIAVGLSIRKEDE